MRTVLNVTSKVRVVLLLAFLLSQTPLNNVLAGKVFASRGTVSTTTVSIDPQFSTIGLGVNLIINVTVADVTDLSVWQVVLKYNATVLNLTDVWIPDDNVFANHSTFTPEPSFGNDSVDGLTYVIYASAIVGVDAVNASTGALMSANFTGLTAGASSITVATWANPAHLDLPPTGWNVEYTFLEDVNLNDISFLEQSGSAAVGFSTYLTLTSMTGGTTNPPPNTYQFINESELSVTALPDNGYDFSNWQLDGSNAGSSDTIDVSMDVNHTLQAIFLPHIPVTWIVDWRGGADFTSIQDAINSVLVKYNDIILVEPGVYHENVEMSKELTLMGTDESTTIIDGNGTGTVVSVYGNLTGFTIRNGDYGVFTRTIVRYNSTQMGLVTYFEDSSRIVGNHIVDNLIGGVIIGSSSIRRTPHDTNCTFSDNVVANNTVFGVHIWDAGNNVLTNNTVENNEYGVDFYGSSYENTLKYNRMIGNKYNFGVILRGETQEWQGEQGLFFLNNDVDTSNTVDGKPIYYWASKQNEQIPADAGYVLLYDCSNISVDNCSLVNNIEGILIYASNNTSIGQNTIANNAFGIITVFSQNNTLSGNSLVGNVYGVYLGPLSKHTTMRNNSISGGQFNFGMDTQFQMGAISDIINGVTSDINNTFLANDIDGSNTLDGKTMIYWIDQHDMLVPANAGFVMLINCTNISVEGLNLTNNLENMLIFCSNDTVIQNNYVDHSVYGIRAADFAYYDYSALESVSFRCFNITVSCNTFRNNGIALDLLYAENCTISGNSLDGNPVGILSDTDFSTITRNTINDSSVSNPADIRIVNDLYVFYYPTDPAFDFAWEWTKELIQLEVAGIIVGGNDNTVRGNTVTNSFFSIILGDPVRNIVGGGNIVFHNNFINGTNHFQAFELLGGTQWDDGYPAGGNYWSDGNMTDVYSGPEQDSLGSDGICDTPYRIVISRISTVVFDRYPLTDPVSVFQAVVSNGVEYDVDVQSNSTISEFVFNGPSQPSLSFTVNGPMGTVGFCRVIIPNQALWAVDGKWTVVVNGTQTPYKLSEDASNTYISFYYVHSTENVLIIGTNAIPEYPQITFPLVLVMLALATALLKARQKIKNS